eukprot:Selendium_serpulae@DN5581_c2_g1_i3.p1
MANLFHGNTYLFHPVANKVPNPIYEFFAEFMGTLGLVAICDSAVMVSVSPNYVCSIHSVTGWFPVRRWTLALVHVPGSISGGHFNTAVTLAFVITGRCPVLKLLWYFPAQLYAIWNPILGQLEAASGIIRGEAGSEAFVTVYQNLTPFASFPITVNWFGVTYGLEVFFTAIFLGAGGENMIELMPSDNQRDMS